MGVRRDNKQVNKSTQDHFGEHSVLRRLTRQCWLRSGWDGEERAWQCPVRRRETTPGYSNKRTLIQGIYYKVIGRPGRTKGRCCPGEASRRLEGRGRGEGMSPPGFARHFSGGSTFVDGGPEFLLRHHSSRQQQRTLTLAFPSDG